MNWILKAHLKFQFTKSKNLNVEKLWNNIPTSHQILSHLLSAHRSLNFLHFLQIHMAVPLHSSGEKRVSCSSVKLAGKWLSFFLCSLAEPNTGRESLNSQVEEAKMINKNTWVSLNHSWRTVTCAQKYSSGIYLRKTSLSYWVYAVR